MDDLIKLNKEPDAIKKEVTSDRTEVEVEMYILKLMNDYHYSLVKNNADEFLDAIDDINTALDTWQYPSMSSYINEYSILAVYSIFNKIFDKDFNLNPSAEANDMKFIDPYYTRELYSVIVKNHLDFKMFKEDMLMDGIDEYYDVLSKIMNPNDFSRFKTHVQMLRKNNESGGK